MDILLAGSGTSLWKGRLPALMSSAATCGNHSGSRRTAFRGWPKSVRLPPGILFAFIPESCSGSTRNAVRLHPGTPLAFARNPQSEHSEGFGAHTTISFKLGRTCIRRTQIRTLVGGD